MAFPYGSFFRVQLLWDFFNVSTMYLYVCFFFFLKKLDLPSAEPEVKPFEEKFGKRILVKCNDLSFNLQCCVAENEEGPTTNVIFKKDFLKKQRFQLFPLQCRHEILVLGIKEVQCLGQDVGAYLACGDRMFVTKDGDRGCFSLAEIYSHNHK